MSVLYDIDFRRSVIKLLARDVDAREKFLSYLKRSYFPEIQLQTIFEALKNLNEQIEEREIGKVELKTEVRDICDIRGEDKSIYEEEIDIIYNTDVDEEFLKKKLKKWIEREELKKVLSKAIDYLHTDKLDEAKDVLETQITIEVGENKGLTFDNPIEFLQKYKQKYDYRYLTSTGYEEYDKALLGGFARGELHTVVAPPKRFKSTFAVNIGFNVLKQHKSVVHITLELPEEDVLAKYYMAGMNRTHQDILNVDEEKFQQEVARLSSLLKSKLFIKYFLPESITTNAIINYIKARREEGELNEIGLIIVDYDDLLLAKSGEKDMYQKAGDVYSDLIKMANYFKCPVFTLAQPNRSAWNLDLQGDLIRAEHLAHSSKKAHFCWSISSLNLKSKNAEGEKKIVLYTDMVRRGVSQKKINLTVIPQMAKIIGD